VGRRAKNEGSIYRRSDGLWVAQLKVGKGQDGRPKRAFRYSKTQAAARRELESLRREHASRSKSDAGDRTVETYLHEWHGFWRQSVSPRTAELYLDYIEKKLVPALGHVGLAELGPLDIDSALITIKDKTRGKGIRTVNLCRQVLAVACKQAVTWQLIPTNPVQAVAKLKAPRKDTRMWTAAETRRFLEVAKSHRMYAAFHLLITTGLRRGELLGLQWRDLVTTGLRIQRSLTPAPGEPNGVRVTRPKTERSERLVALSPDCIQLLTAHRRQQSQELSAVGHVPNDQTFIFTTQLGTVYNPRNLLRLFKALQAEAEVPVVSLHDLRHLHASLLVKSNVDVRSIADRLGHTDPSLTLRIYSHLFEEQRQAAAIPISGLLSA
jgi:integrase